MATDQDSPNDPGALDDTPGLRRLVESLRTLKNPAAKLERLVRVAMGEHENGEPTAPPADDRTGNLDE